MQKIIKFWYSKMGPGWVSHKLLGGNLWYLCKSKGRKCLETQLLLFEADYISTLVLCSYVLYTQFFKN